MQVRLGQNHMLRGLIFLLDKVQLINSQIFQRLGHTYSHREVCSGIIAVFKEQSITGEITT